AWDQRDDLLQVEGKVRRPGSIGGSQTAGSGGREPPAEEAAGRADARQCGAQGPSRKKLLTPRTRHAAVHNVVERHGLSERRATRLLEVDRSAVRYRKKRRMALHRTWQAATERLHGELQR